MAKARVTRKWVNDNFTCCSVGYCDLQNLLRYTSADYYTCGVYGWNFDVYTFGDYAITTGYRGMIDNVRKDYHSIIRKYEDMARELNKKYAWTSNIDEHKAELKKLLADFLKEVFDTEIKVY